MFLSVNLTINFKKNFEWQTIIIVPIILYFCKNLVQSAFTCLLKSGFVLLSTAAKLFFLSLKSSSSSIIMSSAHRSNSGLS